MSRSEKGVKENNKKKRKVSFKKTVLLVFVTTVATTAYTVCKTCKTIENELNNIAEI